VPALAFRFEKSKRGPLMPPSKTFNATLPSYAIVTAAYNEEKCIEKVIESIANQHLLPKKWIIVSDGSADGTDEIVKRYAAKYDFLELVRITEDHPRNFNAQLNAINLGFSHLADTRFAFVANLDADITLDPDYFANLLAEFANDPALGLAGGYIYEEQSGEFRSRSTNSISSVAHGVQCFRRECLEALGGYSPFSWGGTDTHAGVCLRMLGWKVHSIPALKAYHHRPTGGGFGAIRYSFRGGIMDHYLGTHPLFELFRIARRITAKPYFTAAFVRFAGFVWAYCKGAKREVSPEFIEFLRKEQMQKLRATCGPRDIANHREAQTQHARTDV
jgi:poly-beta-1,6-N-acetyl-D-glucosamine synthase